MPGPPPKHPSDRRRRNRVQTVELPADGSGLEAPELPGADDLLEWTRNYWTGLWASPMAVVWEPMDVPALIRLARLQDRQMRGEGTSTELGEIRNLEDRFGLSPMARKRLQWEISRASSESKQGTRAARPAGASSPAKRRLRAV